MEDLPLWEQYLVYASAFGISDRVAKQLVMVYPNLTDTTWLENNASDSLVYPAFVSISQPGGLEASSGNGQGDLQPTTGSPDLSSDLTDFGSRLAEDLHEVLDSIRSAPERGGEVGTDLAGGGGGLGIPAESPVRVPSVLADSRYHHLLIIPCLTVFSAAMKRSPHNFIVHQVLSSWSVNNPWHASSNADTNSYDNPWYEILM